MSSRNFHGLLWAVQISCDRSNANTQVTRDLGTAREATVLLNNNNNNNVPQSRWPRLFPSRLDWLLGGNGRSHWYK